MDSLVGCTTPSVPAGWQIVEEELKLLDILSPLQIIFKYVSVVIFISFQLLSWSMVVVFYVVTT